VSVRTAFRILIPSLLAALGFCLFAAVRWPTGSSPVFAALTLMLTAAALAAAAVAALFAWPGYREWTRAQQQRVDMRPRLAIIHEEDESEEWFGEDGRLTVDGTRFVLRLNLRNDGDKLLRRATLNMIVPRQCLLAPWHPDSDLRSIRASRSDQLEPGMVVPVNTLAAHRDYPPNLHVLHDVAVTLPGPGEWPIFVIVAGDAPQAWSLRVLVTLLEGK